MSTLIPSRPEPEYAIVKHGRRLRAISHKETGLIRQWEIDYRFVREVEYLERAGRVSSRIDLETDIGIRAGQIAVIRAGLRGVTLVQILSLFEKYRADLQHILFGIPRDKERSNPYIPGVGRLDKYTPIIHHYNQSAQWRVGAREETHEGYYPDDPENKLWTPPKRRSIDSLK